MSTPKETLEDIKRTLDWHIEDYLTCEDKRIISITDAYDLGVHMEHNSNEIKEVRARLSAVEKQVKDSRKLKLYAIYTSNKKLTYQEMANEIGISLRTVKYWIQEMKDQGLIS